MKRGEKMKVALIIVCIALVISAFNWFKWKITFRALIYYNEKNQYKHPSRAELSDCIDSIIKYMFKNAAD